MEIRAAVKEDLDAIQKVWHHKAVAPGLGGPSFKGVILDGISRDRYAVATEDGVVVGFCGVSTTIPHRLALNVLGVHPDFQNKGVSEKLYFYWLLKAALRRCVVIDDHVISSENIAMVLWLVKMRFVKLLGFRSRTRRKQDYSLYSLLLPSTDWAEYEWVKKELGLHHEYDIEETKQDSECRQKVIDSGVLRELSPEEKEKVVSDYEFAKGWVND